MRSDQFAEGLEVSYQHLTGVIHFICSSYITVCVRTFEDRVRNVCVLVHRNNWKDLNLLTGNRQDYEK